MPGLFLFFILFLLAGLFSKGIEKEFSKGIGWVGRWGKSGRKWGRENHYQNVLYEKIFFQLKKSPPVTKETKNDSVEPAAL